MPKIVDHEKRRIQIAEATWRVILKSGMEGATVRNIAKEAGLSLGALRHYFSTQDELLKYAMSLAKEQATDRITNILGEDLPPKEKVLKILLQMVPINEQTIAEMEIWLSFTFHFRNRKEDYNAQHDGIYEGMRKLFIFLEHGQLLKPGVDIDLESEKLYALVDGIAIHALLEGDRVNKERVVAVLKNYLDAIID